MNREQLSKSDAEPSVDTVERADLNDATTATFIQMAKVLWGTRERPCFRTVNVLLAISVVGTGTRQKHQTSQLPPV